MLRAVTQWRLNPIPSNLIHHCFVPYVHKSSYGVYMQPLNHLRNAHHACRQTYREKKGERRPSHRHAVRLVGQHSSMTVEQKWTDGDHLTRLGCSQAVNLTCQDWFLVSLFVWVSWLTVGVYGPDSWSTHQIDGWLARPAASWISRTV